METPPRRPVTDVACAGEAMAMFVTEHTGPLTEDTRYRISAAGAEANVARYLARLGASSAWISRLGADPFGDFIVAEMARDGVDVSAVERDANRPTGVAFKERRPAGTAVHYYRRDSAASALGASAAARAWALEPRILHLSGITPALSEDCRAFMTAAVDARPRDGVVSFDVNWRPALWPGSDSGVLRTIAQAADLVFVGLDEAQSAWGLGDVAAVRAAIDGPSILVVKRGAGGCTVFDGDRRIEVPALRVDVTEPVGAGDAFAAGFLHGWLSGADPKHAARMGTIVASSALSVHTDVGALPGREYIEGLLALGDDEWEFASYSPGHETRTPAHVANR